MECVVSPPWLLKHLRTLCGVPTLVWTSDQMSQIGMLGVHPPNSQISYQFSCQFSTTFISECGTSSWACLDFDPFCLEDWMHLNFDQLEEFSDSHISFSSSLKFLYYISFRQANDGSGRNWFSRLTVRFFKLMWLAFQSFWAADK